MPDLTDLLHRAVDPSDPSFGVEDVRARVASSQRRQRRATVALMASVVVLVAVGVVSGLRTTGGDAAIDSPDGDPDSVAATAVATPGPAGPATPASPTPSTVETGTEDPAVATGEQPVAAGLFAAVEAGGLALGERTVDEVSTTATYTPPGVGRSAVWVSVAHEGVDPGWVVDGDTEIVPLADGEAAVLADSGMLAFTCGDASVTTTGPGAGGSDLDSVAAFPTAAGCQPRPPGVPTSFTADDGSTIERWQSIREARVGAAIDRLGLVQCCGEPSHGGSGASTGFEWDGGPEVYVSAGPLLVGGSLLTEGVEVSVADGVARYVEADGLPVTAFDCGDTGYTLMLDSTDADVHVAAAELLVSALACTPSTG